MKQHNFILAPCDTDSISFCKEDMSPFSKEEQDSLLKEINEQMPELIKFDHDGYFKTVIVLKAKNYILDDGEKIKYKGSAITDQKKEPALIEMIHEMVDVLLERNHKDTLAEIYNKYIKESQNITDIKRWCTKKAITNAVLNSERTNEFKVRESLMGENVQQGDKIWVYSALNGYKEEITKSGKSKQVQNRILKLIKNWTNDEDKEHLLKRVHSTAMILKNVVDENLFIKYHIKKNKPLLDKLLND
ncbi:MAG: hypothetical protein HC836_40175 [Richelia sp. RM2_1_2]|nr:hypothetical protein [Richelia sp. RM2_1_2]